jgi:hypothetical protein
MVKVEAVLQKFMAPAVDDWDPIRVYILQELVRDMKDLKFGWGNKNTYDTCHWGISPFAVLQVLMEQQTKRWKTRERAERATFLSVAPLFEAFWFSPDEALWLFHRTSFQRSRLMLSYFNISYGLHYLSCC